MAAQHILNTAHTVRVRVELASALTAATILADAAVTPTVSEMTYNVSSGTLNHAQPTNQPSLRSDTVIVGHSNRSCYLLTYLLTVE